MAVLQNARWERFTQGLASGLAADKAYVAAGFSRKGAAQSASRLLRNAEVRSRVQELKSAIAERVVEVELSARNSRIQALQERHTLLKQLIKERAVDPGNQLAAGGKLGIMVKTVKMIGGGEFSREVEEFAFDRAVMAEMREIEKQIAIECGEWFEHEKSPPVGGASVTVDVGRPDLRALGPQRINVLIQLFKEAEQEKSQ